MVGEHVRRPVPRDRERPSGAPRSEPRAAALLELQRTIGNRATAQLLQAPRQIQRVRALMQEEHAAAFRPVGDPSEHVTRKYVFELIDRLKHELAKLHIPPPRDVKLTEDSAASGEVASLTPTSWVLEIALFGATNGSIGTSVLHEAIHMEQYFHMTCAELKLAKPDRSLWEDENKAKRQGLMKTIADKLGVHSGVVETIARSMVDDPEAFKSAGGDEAAYPVKLVTPEARRLHNEVELETEAVVALIGKRDWFSSDKSLAKVAEYFAQLPTWTSRYKAVVENLRQDSATHEASTAVAAWQTELENVHALLQKIAGQGDRVSAVETERKRLQELIPAARTYLEDELKSSSRQFAKPHVTKWLAVLTKTHDDALAQAAGDLGGALRVVGSMPQLETAMDTACLRLKCPEESALARLAAGIKKVRALPLATDALDQLAALDAALTAEYKTQLLEEEAFRLEAEFAESGKTPAVVG